MSNNLLYLLFVGFISHLIDWFLVYKMIDKVYVYIVCFCIYILFPFVFYCIEGDFLLYWGYMLGSSFFFVPPIFLLYIIYSLAKYVKKRKT
jgi:hypothetical protein